jgi:uncharacterized membrane protein YhhN
MLPEIANLALVVLALASGSACIASDVRDRRLGVYVFKPLTMLLVLALALQPTASTSPSYRGAVTAGLVCSLAGDVFLMLPRDRFVAGLASFLVAHVFYVVAFAAEAGPTARPDALLPFALAAGALYALLWPRLGRLRVPVLVYVAAIVVMAWQATARWLLVGQLDALLACAGAVLFVVSDAALALNRFHRTFRGAQVLVLGTYFPGQLLIALSVGAGAALVDWGIR